MKITLKSLQEVGKYQWCAILLFAFGVTPGGWGNSGILLIAPKLDSWCNDNSSSFTNLSQAHQREIMTSINVKCHKPGVNFTSFNGEDLVNFNFTGENWISCDQGIQYDRTIFQYTATEKYNLGCGKEWLIAVGNSVYMAGYFVSAIGSGSLADRFGRKPVLVAAFLLGGSAHLLAAFAPFIELFFVARFFAAVADIAGYGCGYIICLEILRKDQRLLAGFMANCAYVISGIGLGVVAMGVRNHEYILMIISVMFFIFTLLHGFFMPESPRWLASRKRHNEAKSIIERIAQVNKQDIKDLDYLKLSEDDNKKASNTSPLNLLKTPLLRKRTLLLWLIWFATVMVNYGLIFNLGDFGTDIRITLIVSAALDIPQLILIMTTIDHFGRQVCVFVYMLIAGFSCLAMWPLVEEKGSPWLLALALIGKMFASTVLFTAYQHTPELYPTNLRTQGLGAASTIGRIGGMIAPQISLLNQFWSPALVVILGSATILATAVVPFLPDTTSRELAQTIPEGEKFLADHGYKLVLPPKYSCCGQAKQRKNTTTDLDEV